MTSKYKNQIFIRVVNEWPLTGKTIVFFKQLGNLASFWVSIPASQQPKVFRSTLSIVMEHVVSEYNSFSYATSRIIFCNEISISFSSFWETLRRGKVSSSFSHLNAYQLVAFSINQWDLCTKNRILYCT